MSGRSFVLLFALLIAGSANAQNHAKEKLEITLQGCISAIHSNHAGLRESGVSLAAKIRNGYPDADLQKLAKELQRVMNKDKFSSIRVHAAMIIAYINDPFLYKRINAPDDDEAFLGFYSKLNEELYKGFYESIQQIGTETMIAML
jgi:hypothetical protein